MDVSTSPFGRLSAYAPLVLLLLCLELLFTNTTGFRGLPLNSGYFWPTVLVLLGLVTGTVMLDHWLLSRVHVGRIVWYELTAAVVLYRAAHRGSLTRAWPWAFLIGLVLAFWLPVPRQKGEGPVLFLVWAVLNLFVMHVWIAAALVLPVVLVVFLRWFEAAVVPSRRLRRWLVVVVACLAVLTWWHWSGLGPTDTFKQRFNGTVPPVNASISTDDLPNLILISVDTLRWDMVPPRAPAEFSLQNLRALRHDSLSFPAAFAPSSTTLHTHASLFTGLQPSLTGTFHGSRHMYDALWLYPQFLKKMGYRTTAFTGGGYVRKELGFSRGYERYREYPEAYGNLYPGGFFWLEFFLPSWPFLPFNPHTKHGRSGRPLRRFEQSVANSLQWMDGLNDQEPFHLFLHTYQVHDYKRLYPYAMRRLREEHPGLLNLPLVERVLSRERYSLTVALNRFLPQLLERLQTSSAEAFGGFYAARSPGQKRTIRDRLERELDLASVNDSGFRPQEKRLHRRLAGYYAVLLKTQQKLYGYTVELTDRHLGDLIRGLKERELYDETAIVLLSDHGEGFLQDSTALGHGKLWGRHPQLQDVLIRVPLWVKLPGNRHRNQSVRDLFKLTDLFPFLLDRLTHETPVFAEGRSDTRTEPTPVPEIPPRGIVKGSMPLQDSPAGLKVFARSPRHKLVAEMDTGRRRWFRVQENGFHQRRVPPSNLPPRKRSLLETHARRTYSRYRTIRSRREPGEKSLSSDVKQELRGLGYLR